VDVEVIIARGVELRIAFAFFLTDHVVVIHPDLGIFTCRHFGKLVQQGGHIDILPRGRVEKIDLDGVE